MLICAGVMPIFSQSASHPTLFSARLLLLHTSSTLSFSPQTAALAGFRALLSSHFNISLLFSPSAAQPALSAGPKVPFKSEIYPLFDSFLYLRRHVYPALFGVMPISPTILKYHCSAMAGGVHISTGHACGPILEHGYDLLAIDLDHTFVDLRLVLLKPPGTLLRALRSTRTLHNRTADVIALHDGKSRMMLNVGLIFIRSTPATISLVQRVEKRSFAAWEQAVFNEELNFGEHSIGTGEPDIACCHSERGSACDIGNFLRPFCHVSMTWATSPRYCNVERSLKVASNVPTLSRSRRCPRNAVHTNGGIDSRRIERVRSQVKAGRKRNLQ